MSPTSTAQRSPSHYIEEPNDPFLKLFPYRYDFIQAPYPQSNKSPNWQTETRHPLSDRAIQEGGCLYGVRFGSNTEYLLLDIDIGSEYHPYRAPFAIREILHILEVLGITHYIPVRSSSSGGIHIYIPLAKAQKSSQLASAVQLLLEHNNYKIAPGKLELFPDPKLYVANGKRQLYAAHRLPLQSGSYLLNSEWEAIYSTQAEFVRRWKFCQEQNHVTEATLKRIIKRYRRKHYGISTNAAKFLNDLNTEIETGWTAPGQTNRLLGRIALREYVFGHILEGGVPLEDMDLVHRIVKVAQTCPGYTQYCNHQHEIYKRAEEWARSVEKSHYFHHGSRSSTLSQLKPQPTDKREDWNQQQSQTARNKIRQAIAHMLNTGTLPAQTTERFQALIQHNISGATLYKHKDLWHPSHLQDAPPEEPEAPTNPKQIGKNSNVRSHPVEIPPSPPQLINGTWAQSKKDYAHTATSLLLTNGCNTPYSKAFGDLHDQLLKSGCNFAPQQTVETEGVQQNGHQQAIATQQQLQQDRQRKYIEQMQQYLVSGDPILMAEAHAFAQQNPGLLQPPPPPPNPSS